MKPGRQFNSYEEFAREELLENRSSSWCIDDLADDFIVCADLDLDLIEGEEEEPEEDEEED